MARREPLQVSSDPADDWNPVVAADSAGNVTVVWDSYRNGNYDVYLRQFRDNQPGPETAVVQSAPGQMNAAAVYDAQDRLWVAYDEVNTNWGKDNGGRTLRFPSDGKTLGDQRTIRVRILENGLWKQPRAEVETALLEGRALLDPVPAALFRHGGPRVAAVPPTR